MEIRTTRTDGGRSKGAAEPIQAAADYGIDISPLRDNLALTVAERLRRHQVALNALEMLQQAGRPLPVKRRG
jgi:hypothetical protein